MDIRKFFGGKPTSSNNIKNDTESESLKGKKKATRSKPSDKDKVDVLLSPKQKGKCAKSGSKINVEETKHLHKDNKVSKVSFAKKDENVSTSVQEKKSRSSIKRKQKETCDSSEDEPLHIVKKRKKSVIVELDSEEELQDSTMINKQIVKSAPIHVSDSFTQVIPKPSGSKLELQNKKSVVALDFFGSLPVQRRANNQEKNIVVSNQDNNIQSEDGSLTLSKKLSRKRKIDEETFDKLPKAFIEEQGHTNVLVADVPSHSVLNSKGHSSSTSDAQSAKKDEDRRKSYLAFRQREPPRALGSKEIPEGEENCLEGLTFVLTGIYESIDRDDCKSLIEKYGGKVTTSVSRNTKYLVVGRDAGDSKIAKAKELKTKQIGEDGLFDLLKTLPGKKSKYELNAEVESGSKSKKYAKKPSNKLEGGQKQTSLDIEHESTSSKSSKCEPKESPITDCDLSSHKKSLLWVDKYKPTSMKSIIGQQGEKSQAKKLLNWILNWHKNINKKPIWGRPSDDGSEYRAALLSGPPGVGKTTTAHIACQEAGFSFFELNASDTRSKGSLKGIVSEAVNNHSLYAFFNNSTDVSLNSKKHCIVMDEVDGMAGNEDRGGIQELIQFIKTSHIPIICMCNDRQHPKVRSLANYCFDLRFPRPRKEQIKGSMMTIAFKEGFKIPPPALDEIILAANQDIRQVIHNLYMWTAKDKVLTYEQLKSDATRAQKDLHFSPFDVCRKVFSGWEDSKKMTLNNKSDLFFHDYSIAPLFVQENYLAVKPYNAQMDSWKHLSLLGKAASSISMGDLVDGQIRKNQQWGLLPTQAMFASVIPGEIMNGNMGNTINFPSWLGKNSTSNKNSRLIQELTLHSSLSASCGKQSLNLDYIPALKHLLTLPLTCNGSEGVGEVLSVMNAYNFLREDFDNVLELNNWSDSKDVQIEAKVKRAFTLAYNKSSHLMPYSNVAVKKLRAGAVDDVEEVDEEIIEEEESDITADAMIVAKKSKSNTKSKSLSAKSSEPKKGKQTQKKNSR